MVSSILTQYANSHPALQKIGLYTSPHLRFVRERIQINGEPISAPLFTYHFFRVWDALTAAAAQAGHTDPESPTTKPVYFRYLTLMALSTYLLEGVKTAVIEVGIGGEYDSTNIIVHPSVTAITSLGIDHTPMLGTTLPEIAWHKAGIMKKGTTCFTIPQASEAMAVLQQRAEEKGVNLQVVERHPEIDTIPLGLAGEFQKTNASLAIAVAAAHLQSLGLDISTSPLPDKFYKGLKEVRWGGRCETRIERGISWHLDGGHTTESVEEAGRWFASCVSGSVESVPCFLIFNQQLRAAQPLLSHLLATLRSELKRDDIFTQAVFCTNVTFRSTGYQPDLLSVNTNKTEVENLTVQQGLAETWKELGGTRDAKVHGTIEEAIEFVENVSGPANEGKLKARVLVTGSVHLVGGVLEVLESRE